jgi:hypothetical protein
MVIRMFINRQYHRTEKRSHLDSRTLNGERYLDAILIVYNVNNENETKICKNLVIDSHKGRNSQ